MRDERPTPPSSVNRCRSANIPGSFLPGNRRHLSGRLRDKTDDVICSRSEHAQFHVCRSFYPDVHRGNTHNYRNEDR